MYDALTTRYTFPCPARGETRVRLSAFRILDRLPGAEHPALFHVVFDCPCGEEHPGLVSDSELDWAPLGLTEDKFLNLMTARLEEVASELSDLAVRKILAGEWPWTFFCYPEDRPRPVFPSSFFLLAPGDGSVGLAVRCPTCNRVSVNLVSHEHVDLPFHNDPEIGVIPHVFAGDVADFRDELDSGRFDPRRLLPD
jgi:hypothetical protein